MRKLFGGSSFDSYCFGGLLAIEVLMSFTFLGYIHFPPISLTIAYIPIIVAACLFGTTQAIVAGILFGLGSLYKASASYVLPTDMIFSPFRSTEPFASFLLSVGTRALLGLFVGLAFDAVRSSKHFRSFMCLFSILAVHLHAVLVYGAMGIFFPQFGFDCTSAFSSGSRDFVAAIVTMLIVAAVWEIYNSQKVQQVKLYVDRSNTTSHMYGMLKNRAMQFFLGTLTLTIIAGAYFTQRTIYMFQKHGIKIESNLAGDLLHLQLQFVMAIIALNVILLLLMQCAYKYFVYMEYLGAMDSLTGVMGRKLFLNNCQKLQNKLAFIANKQSGWFLFLDIDQFKSINDTYGHPVGDKVLTGFAAKLDKALSEYGIVGRLGGDEFAAMLYKPLSKENLATLLDDFYKQIADIIPEQKITSSIGVCTFKYPQEVAMLLYTTDKALYKAKERGRACYEFVEL